MNFLWHMPDSACEIVLPGLWGPLLFVALPAALIAGVFVEGTRRVLRLWGMVKDAKEMRGLLAAHEADRMAYRSTIGMISSRSGAWATKTKECEICDRTIIT